MMNLIVRLQHRCSYLPKYKIALEKHYKRNELIQGWCTPQASLAYSQRNPKVHAKHWRSPIGIDEALRLSSLGIGTFNGEPSNQFDYEMFGAIADSLQSGGVNMIDTCTLYRYGKSQKIINAVLNYLIKEKGYKREEFMIATKAGYIPRDIDSNLEEKDFINMLVAEKIIKAEDVVQDLHCVAPNFLEFSLEKSRQALGLNTIDVAYLNNFSEAHLAIVGEDTTYQRLKHAFAKLEQMRSNHKIRYYGICSYVGLRSPTTEAGVHFKLEKAVKIAKQIAGNNHGFRFLMVPFSLGTPEALLKWQNYNTSQVRVLDIAEAQNINVVLCSPLFQGKVANVPFQNKSLDYLEHQSAKHLQLVRSLPFPAVLSTMVGMTQQEHVKQNLSLLDKSPLTVSEWKNILPIPE